MVIFDYRRKIWKDVLDYISKIKGRTLDVGCGNGGVTKLIRNSVGVDVSFELLEKGEGKFVQGKCEALPFKNKSFDNVLLIAVLHNLKEKNRVKCLKEINKVLKSKGKLFLSVWYKDHWVVKRKGKKLIRVFEKLKYGDNYLGWGKKEKRYYYFFKKKELESLLTSSGFKIKKFVKSGDNYFVSLIKGPAEI